MIDLCCLAMLYMWPLMGLVTLNVKKADLILCDIADGQDCSDIPYGYDNKF